MDGGREYVILKRHFQAITVPMSRGSSQLGPQPEEKLDVSVQTLTEREAADIKRDPKYTMAPAMTLRLIKPKSRKRRVTRTEKPLWGLEAIGATTTNLTGAGVVVAVLDTGIDRQHEAFSHMPPDRLEERDFTEEGNGDVDGHGTHCAGTIFGSTVNGVRIGIAPAVERALIGKVLGSEGASTASLISAIQWALESGANVISMSLGMDFPAYSKKLVKAGYPTALATSKALEAYRENTKLFDALGELIRASEAFRQAAIVIAAAGNASERDVDPEHVISVEPPATSDEILSVGAVARIDGSFEIAPFSNTGPNIVAPGVDIPSAQAGGGMADMSGTSMATPHVAGAAALWVEYLVTKKRRISLDILHAKLTGTALPIDAANQSDVGLGLIQVPPND